MTLIKRLNENKVEPVFEARNLIQLFIRAGGGLMRVSLVDYDITDMYLYPLSPTDNKIVPVLEKRDKNSGNVEATYFDYESEAWIKYEPHENKTEFERPKPKGRKLKKSKAKTK